MWDREFYLDNFNEMDRVNKPKYKYMLLHGFVKGIMYSDESLEAKDKLIKDVLSAFDESLKNEVNKLMNNEEGS